ncbi:MAG: SDR family NAD(P)-dependent oxidoreductase, partial [Chloroflexota bacterium]
MSQKTILITGATDGIGLALAQYYAQRAAFQPTRLVLVGRRSLEELYAAGLPAQLFTPITYLQTDLAQADGVQKIRNWLQYFNINQIDLLINNAAMGYIGPVEVQTPENIEQLVNVNLHTPIALTHALLPFVEQVQGKIVYISSVASIYPAPDYATYVATKAALEGFVRNLHIELKAAKRKVSVQLIRPGATRTGIHSKSGATPAHISRKQWENFDSAVNVATDIA